MKKSLFVATLVLTVSAILCGTAFAQDQATYVSNKQCKICHNTKDQGEIWNVWKGEKHSLAFESLKSDKAKEVAQKAGVTEAPEEAPQCLACHVTAYNAETKSAPETIAKEDGVQCETCHGPASLHIIDGKAYKTSKDASINMAAHIQRADEKTCVKCHNDKNPTWDPNKYTLPDGTKTGFDFKQAWENIKHENPSKTK